MSENPPVEIATAQNTGRAQRLLAAQSRLYTDAKKLHDFRVSTVVGLAVITVIVALSAPEARTVVGSIGGSVAFLWSLLGGGREKRSRKQASLVQEEFDTQVFAMPWAVMADHPSPSLIAAAASAIEAVGPRIGMQTLGRLSVRLIS